jgi:hypothetical protein
MSRYQRRSNRHASSSRIANRKQSVLRRKFVGKIAVLLLCPDPQGMPWEVNENNSRGLLPTGEGGLTLVTR